MEERRLIEVEGTVQGVGFRPFVHRLAAAADLRGYVRNDRTRVQIDIEGDAARVEAFCRGLTTTPPPLSLIASVTVTAANPGAHESFRIVESGIASAPAGGAAVPPDVAPCDRCLSELFDPGNRRHGHAFIACTDCGPRASIVHAAPFDRQRTAMVGFPRCAECEREYHDSADRRFHAEITCCPECGPVMAAHFPRAAAAAARGAAALALAANTLRRGGVIALKAVGGFHLACDAGSSDAVARLRSSKHRPDKPFALMVRDLAAAAALCELTPEETVELCAPARPIVLLRSRTTTQLAGVAPGAATLGVALPSSPIHHLLLASFDRPLVMTSGNISGAPVEIDNASAMRSLAEVVDLFLIHDRAIVARADDSVLRVIDGTPMLMRRARGFVPHRLALTGMRSSPPVLAVGGHQKNTVCLAHAGSALLSAHIGDLDDEASCDAMRAAMAALVRAAGTMPAAVAHDLHPQYASTRVGTEYAVRHAIPHRVPVQHHHAHVAACLAEHNRREPVLGVVFDGAGLGTDGAVWGGEFLVVEGSGFRRHGHLAYVPLPGGDAAARHPWRSAMAHVAAVPGRLHPLDAVRPPHVADGEWHLVHQLLECDGRSPRTSSVGRLFDAVASLLGVCHDATFEGQAAMAVEALAGARRATAYPIRVTTGDPWTIDPAQIIDGILHDLKRGRDRDQIAAAFHDTLAALIVLACDRMRDDCGIATVVLSGGVFMNARLTTSARMALAARGFRVLVPRAVPCNDGGLALGQAYVATLALEEAACV